MPAQKEHTRKAFAFPPANGSMRRVYAYLLKRRLLDRDVLTAFAKAGLLYESCEKYNDREIHNAVFVGKDEHGVARHAHKRSVNDIGKSFRINIEGSDPRYSFHHAGTSDRLYVFEAPIDLLSFLTLYPKNWQQHSFVSLCGTSEHAMLSMPNMLHYTGYYNERQKALMRFSFLIVFLCRWRLYWRRSQRCAVGNSGSERFK